MTLEKRDKALLQDFHGLFLALGVLMTIFGILLVIFPFIGTIAVDLILGVALFVTGITGIVFGIVGRKWTGSALLIINGILSAVVGSILLFYPRFGIATLTLFIGVVIAMQGIFEMVKSAHVRSKFWKNTLIVDGIFSLLLGLLVLIGWPSDSIWVIGILLGVSLLFAGITSICFASAIKKL